MSRPRGISDEEWRLRENKRIADWRAKNYERESAKWKAYREKNVERERNRVKEWWSVPENRARATEQQKQYAKEHPEVNKKATARYRENHRLEIREKNKLKARKLWKEGKPQKRHKERLSTDPVYMLSIRIRNRIRVACSKAKKGTRKHDMALHFRKHFRQAVPA